MVAHAHLFTREGHKPFIVAGRGDPSSVGLEGVIIPELDSRHSGILKAQALLRDDEERGLAEIERWADRICELLTDVLAGADVCIVHNAFTLHKNLALTVALARMAEHSTLPIRWIAWCHDLAWNNPLYAEELRPRWPWTPLKYPLPNVNYVAISEQRLEEMTHLFRVPESEITLVPNGIDPTLFLPSSPEMDAIRRRLHWDEREWVFLCPVRITRRKNIELAIDIVAHVRRLGVRPLLVVTGPPGPHNVRSSEYLNELLERRERVGAEDEVVFLAVEGGEGGTGLDVSDALMPELYWWADALLLPSMQEGFGLPLLEAGLARLPIFCSNIAVLREVGGRDAHYFDPRGNPEEIAAEVLETLRKAGPFAYRRKVLAAYSWDSIFKSRIIPLLYGEDASSER